MKYKQRKPKPLQTGFRLTSDDVVRLKQLQAKYPEMTATAIIRRGLRELFEREKVA